MPSPSRTVFGHPAGLFTLFFVEMWERFSYYGMRALLMFYMLKGFLRYADADAIAVYGAYTSLVYLAPFFGGILADRLLGARRAVILGGLLMAAGHLLMTVEQTTAFFAALALLICGNGFFKPNISTIVGSLYPRGSPRRDGGFTIFYMGVNLGAAMSPLLCGYVGETYGWHRGFGLATLGMLTGVAVFVAPRRLTQVLIASGAAVAAVGLLFLRPENAFSLGMNLFVAVSLLVAGMVSWIALERGRIPSEAGAPPDLQRLRAPLLGPISAEWCVYLGAAAVVLALVLLVSGFAPLTHDHRPLTLVADSLIERLQASQSRAVRVLAVVLKESSRPAGLLLLLAGVGALVYIGSETVRLQRIARHRMYVILILTFFSMLFWAFFEQAGSSLNNFADRNVDRVTERWHVSPQDLGRVIRLQPTQEQLGFHNGTELFTLDVLNRLREQHRDSPKFEILWTVAEDNVGMGIADRFDETPASIYQSVNAAFILMFGLVFTALWTFLSSRGLEPSTPVKFALGLLQLGLGFAAFWLGAQTADARGMVALGWLLLGYLLHTTGELCLSPVGLAMVSRLSPGRLVSTVMGTWFLATALSQFLAAIIAQFTGTGHGGPSDARIPVPSQTVHVYGDVFGLIAISAMVSAGVCLALAPVLTRWMHPEVADSGEQTSGEG